MCETAKNLETNEVRYIKKDVQKLTSKVNSFLML